MNKKEGPLTPKGGTKATATEVHGNIKLVRADKEMIIRFIVKLRNIARACAYADIHYATFMKAMYENSTIKIEQKNRLLEYCRKIEEKQIKQVYEDSAG